MKNEDLKPCPFCGSIKIYYCSIYPRAFFSCEVCETDGPIIKNVNEDSSNELMEKALKIWNERK